MEENKFISLFDLNNHVKLGLKKLFPESYWVVGEISEMNLNQSGHCYLELIEKSSETEQIIARAKATIWAYTFRMLKPYFESVTGQRLSVGLKVMIMVSIEFHELYGYSLNVKDIEPNFTLGDLTRKKQEIIKQLQSEGVFDLNKQLDFPIVPQKIAVISSETAAGYGDFVDQLNQNNYGYKFYIKLFQAYMQGAEAEKSIISALEQIFETGNFFDLVVIIRGGGSQADLDCFNSYWLSYHITQFPIPILTGIGHERDETIADLVAFENLKTPTAVAEYIISKTAEFEMEMEEISNQALSIINDRIEELYNELENARQRVVTYSKLYLTGEFQKVQQISLLMKKELKNYLKRSSANLAMIKARLKSASQKIIPQQKRELSEIKRNLIKNLKTNILIEENKLDKYSEKVLILDPVNILKRGYTITYKNGMVVKNSDTLKAGDIISTQWHNGSADSVISTIQKKK
jgi:exodeoxyribonuclease VII large subunit